MSVECLCRVITRFGGGDMGTVPLPIEPFVGLEIKTGKPIVMDYENNEYKGEGIITITNVTYNAKSDKIEIMCNNKVDQDKDWPEEAKEREQYERGEHKDQKDNG